MREATTPELTAHIQGEHATLARIMSLLPRGGAPVYFTDHDEDIEYDGINYLSASGFECSAIQNVVGGGNSNLEVAIFVDTDATRQLIIGGYYAGAAIVINVVNYADLTMGHMPMTVGLVTNVSLPYRQKAVLSFQGRAASANKYLTEVYSPTCRAIFCDARCSLNVNDFRETFTVETATGNKAFTSSDFTQTDGFWNLGVVRWQTGDNAGQTTEIRTQTGPAVALLIRTKSPIQIGDTAVIERGCSKTLAACRAYNNVLNFRGEPFMPGSDFAQNGTASTPPVEAGVAPTAPPTDGASYG
jgi:uncharacterized phage protein (TIGR02218 family)